MKPSLRAALICLAGGLSAVTAFAVESATEEVSIGFLPREWVAAALQKTLSAQGRSVLVTATGPVRLSDVPERVNAARRALLEMQRAPALIAIDLSFATTARRTVQRLPAEPPVLERGIPVPNNYDPPRILVGPNNVTVIPAQPRDFVTHNVGPGTDVNLSPTGYTTREPEVRLSETETATIFARRLVASTVLGKAVTLPVLRQVADPAALRKIALQRGAITEAEPTWAAAGTELIVTPEPSGGAIVLHLLPQIVVPAAAGQPPRRIPISACAAGILVARGAPPSSGLLPQTDPEFYRVFLGAAPADNDTFTALTVKTDVQYLGSPPQ